MAFCARCHADGLLVAVIVVPRGQPLLQGRDYRVGLRVDLDRQRSHEKVDPPPRICRPPLPPGALAVIARRA
jgi:hypothetical protein